MSIQLLELYVFVLAAFVGYMVISRVPPAAPHAADGGDERDLGHLARRIDHCRGRTPTGPCRRFSDSSRSSARRATFVGGFLITDRMLKMFQSGREEKSR
jgi:hypothetical protein